MNLNVVFPSYRNLTPAEVAWAQAFESATGWKLAGTNSVKDSTSFWKMAETNTKKFESWAAQVQAAIALPPNRQKLPPKAEGKGTPPAPPANPADSFTDKIEE